MSLVYVDIVNLLRGTVHTVMKNTDFLLRDFKESGLEISAYNSKYIIMYRYQNAGQNHGIKTDTISFEILKQLKYIETNLTNQNCTQKEIKGIWNSGNACYHLVQNILFSSLL